LASGQSKLDVEPCAAAAVNLLAPPKSKSKSKFLYSNKNTVCTEQ